MNIRSFSRGNELRCPFRETPLLSLLTNEDKRGIQTENVSTFVFIDDEKKKIVSIQSRIICRKKTFFFFFFRRFFHTRLFERDSISDEKFGSYAYNTFSTGINRIPVKLCFTKE